MADSKNTNAEAIAKSVEKVADSRGLAEIGKGLGAGLVALACALAFAVMALTSSTSKWDGHLFPQKECFSLQEAAGKIYKLDKCSGSISPIENTAK